MVDMDSLALLYNILTLNIITACVFREQWSEIQVFLGLRELTAEYSLKSHFTCRFSFHNRVSSPALWHTFFSLRGPTMMYHIMPLDFCSSGRGCVLPPLLVSLLSYTAGEFVGKIWIPMLTVLWAVSQSEIETIEKGPLLMFHDCTLQVKLHWCSLNIQVLIAGFTECSVCWQFPRLKHKGKSTSSSP